MLKHCYFAAIKQHISYFFLTIRWCWHFIVDCFVRETRHGKVVVTVNVVLTIRWCWHFIVDCFVRETRHGKVVVTVNVVWRVGNQGSPRIVDKGVGKVCQGAKVQTMSLLLLVKSFIMNIDSMKLLYHVSLTIYNGHLAFALLKSHEQI